MLEAKSDFDHAISQVRVPAEGRLMLTLLKSHLPLIERFDRMRGRDF